MIREPSRPTPIARQYADRALPASRSSAEALPDAAVHAFQGLHGQLRTVFGEAGCEALFRRSVSRVASQHPFLKIAEAERTPQGVVDALRRLVRPETAAGFAEAVRAIMVEEISLLSRFIGEDLVRNLLHIELKDRPAERAEDEERAHE